MGEKRYLIEKYKDEHNTLHQSIMTDLELNWLSLGKEHWFNKSQINPNLTICYERIYLDEYHQPILIERLINDEWVEIESKNEEKKYE